MNKRTYNYLSKEKAIPSPSGERYKDKNILVKDGENLSLKTVGRVDTVELIKSHRDGVDLSRMIQRFQRGDVNALENRKGFYADVSGYETDFSTAINKAREIGANLSEIGKIEDDPAQDPAEIKNENSENVSEIGKEGVENA